MSTNATSVKSSRSSQIMAWAVASLFILGFYLLHVGAWTGPILAHGSSARKSPGADSSG